MNGFTCWGMCFIRCWSSMMTCILSWKLAPKVYFFFFSFCRALPCVGGRVGRGRWPRRSVAAIDRLLYSVESIVCYTQWSCYTCYAYVTAGQRRSCAFHWHKQERMHALVVARFRPYTLWAFLFRRACGRWRRHFFFTGSMDRGVKIRRCLSSLDRRCRQKGQAGGHMMRDWRWGWTPVLHVQQDVDLLYTRMSPDRL